MPSRASWAGTDFGSSGPPSARATIAAFSAPVTRTTTDRALAMTGGPGSSGAPLFLAASTLFACAVAPYAMSAALRLAAD